MHSLSTICKTRVLYRIAYAHILTALDKLTVLSIVVRRIYVQKTSEFVRTQHSARILVIFDSDKFRLMVLRHLL